MLNILIIGSVWPEPRSSAAGSRMLQLIHAFLEHKFKITFVSSCSKTENAFNLETLGIEQHIIELNNSSFDVFVQNLKPDFVLFDRFMTEEQYGWRVTEHCPLALKILDTEDLHGLRKGRQLALKDEKPFDTNYLFNNISKREIASIFRSDLSLIISEAEMEILQNDFKVDKDLLFYVPFLVDEINSESINKLPKFEERVDFITIGNFLHEPNYDAVLFLKKMIWPLIRKKLPKAELHIYGAYESQKVKQLHKENEGFFIKGFTENVHDVMQNAKVCLAPLQFGAGLKGKLIDAMQNGTPCAMTPIAAEGMFGQLEENGFIETNTEQFAESAIKLYYNKEIWCKKQTNGFKVVNNRFRKDSFEKQLISKIETLRLNLETHRKRNFIGQMLQHHSLQSTKFMSRWIEEKNKHKTNYEVK